MTDDDLFNIKTVILSKKHRINRYKNIILHLMDNIIDNKKHMETSTSQLLINLLKSDINLNRLRIKGIEMLLSYDLEGLQIFKNEHAEKIKNPNHYIDYYYLKLRYDADILFKHISKKIYMRHIL